MRPYDRANRQARTPSRKKHIPRTSWQEREQVRARTKFAAVKGEKVIFGPKRFSWRSFFDPLLLALVCVSVWAPQFREGPSI